MGFLFQSCLSPKENPEKENPLRNPAALLAALLAALQNNPALLAALLNPNNPALLAALQKSNPTTAALQNNRCRAALQNPNNPSRKNGKAKRELQSFLFPSVARKNGEAKHPGQGEDKKGVQKEKGVGSLRRVPSEGWLAEVYKCHNIEGSVPVLDTDSQQKQPGKRKDQGA